MTVENWEEGTETYLPSRETPTLLPTLNDSGNFMSVRSAPVDIAQPIKLPSAVGLAAGRGLRPRL
jgi:hypothetical protein